MSWARDWKVNRRDGVRRYPDGSYNIADIKKRMSEIDEINAKHTIKPKIETKIEPKIVSDPNFNPLEYLTGGSR